MTAAGSSSYHCHGTIAAPGHNSMQVDEIRSLIARRLPRLIVWEQSRGFRRWLWDQLLVFYAKGQKPVRVFLHGQTLILNPGSPYSFVLARYPHFDAGLAATAKVLRDARRRPLNVVDVGSAIGDTVAMLSRALPGGLAQVLCIDGASENLALFQENTRHLSNITVEFTMLTAAATEVATLTRHHPGTAAATGKARTNSKTLDQVIAEKQPETVWDLLKVDTDGFDGEVLRGAVDHLRKHQPVVVFEWHPYLVEKCGNDPYAAFEALANAGYNSYLWFNNRGSFSHFSALPSREQIADLGAFLIAKNNSGDPHFDIVALPPSLHHLRSAIAEPCPAS